MRSMFILLVLFSIAAESAFAAGSEAIIKQRAKELSNQNNVRQGVAPPAASQAPQAQRPSSAVTPLTPMAKLQTDLAAIKVNTPVTTAQKQQITTDLIALAQGARKPSAAAASKLAQDMTTALSQKTPSEGARSRLVQDLNAAFNPAAHPTVQMQDVIADVQAVFQTSGIARKDAVVIGEGVKAIIAEIQGAAK